MKFIALIAILLVSANTLADDTSEMLDNLEAFAEKVDQLHRGEVTVYEVANKENSGS